MLKSLLFLQALFFGPAVCAQSINMDSIFEPQLRGEIFQAKTGVDGNQFYSNDWIKSDIQLSSGEMVFNKQLKYNILLDEVIWLKPNSYLQVKLEKHFINDFYLKNHNGKNIHFKRILVKLPSRSDSTDIFVEVLVEKSSSLYVFRSVRIEGSVSNINGVDRYFDKIIPDPNYILTLPDKHAVTFKRINKRLFLNALPENYRNTFKETIHQNHLSIRTENDLAKLVSSIKL